MKLLDSLLEKLMAGDVPNKFTLNMGELIHKARKDAGYSQRELSERIYRRQAALSDMENGKMEPNASTLLYLAFNLNKPISYFFPDPFTPEKNLNDLTDLEKEILLFIRKMDKRDQRKILAQIKAIIDFE